MELREKLIRIAHEKPELRKHLLPIIKEARQEPAGVDSLIKSLSRIKGVDEVYAVADA